MLERNSGWIKSAAPTLIFIFAFVVGMKVGFWAQSAIIIWAIIHYAFRDEADAEKVKQQIILLSAYAAIMAYASLNVQQTLRKIEDICEETSREDDDKCSRILYEIRYAETSDYDEPY